MNAEWWFTLSAGVLYLVLTVASLVAERVLVRRAKAQQLRDDQARVEQLHADQAAAERLRPDRPAVDDAWPAHPSWCSPEWCELTDTLPPDGGEHVGEPLTLDLPDVFGKPWHLIVQLHQEHVPDDDAYVSVTGAYVSVTGGPRDVQTVLLPLPVAAEAVGRISHLLLAAHAEQVGLS